MNSEEFIAMFFALNPGQRDCALYSFLGRVSVLATTWHEAPQKKDIVEAATESINYAKKCYPEEKIA